MWTDLNRFHPRNNLVLGGISIGMGYMNLVTAISRYTWVHIALKFAYITIHSPKIYCCLVKFVGVTIEKKSFPITVHRNLCRPLM